MLGGRGAARHRSRRAGQASPAVVIMEVWQSVSRRAEFNVQGPAGSATEAMMARIEAQAVLFGVTPLRARLMDVVLPAAAGRAAGVNIWRNHAIEPVLSLCAPYIAYGHWMADFRLSDYDDTLMFAGRQEAALELLWLDSSRYLASMTAEVWTAWLATRIDALRAVTMAPIIVATWLPDAAAREVLQALADARPAVYLADLGALCDEAGVALLDARSAGMAGTPLSRAAQLHAARALACLWLPACLLPPVKAVALDLDNTLHVGVLGEDGVAGVELTAAHCVLQENLKALRQRGVFLALVSRNAPADVEALFADRADYPLRREDFSAFEVSWDDKAVALARIATALRIAPDAILYVDDNPGELASVAARLPDIRAVHADADAHLTWNAIRYYPGLWRWRIEADDLKRVRDLQASGEREQLLAAAADPAEYFRSLQVSLTYRHDPATQIDRLADLCRKTNQFNLAIRRFNQAELAERLRAGDACVTSVQLQDRLSDSGVVGVIVAERRADRLVVEELCISCRAMGRQLEDTMILGAIRGMPIFAGCRSVAFRVGHGPRNQPALEWLQHLLHAGPLQPGLHEIPAERLVQFSPADGIALIEG